MGWFDNRAGDDQSLKSNGGLTQGRGVNESTPQV